MKILLIGGYGNFGKRLAASLLANYDHDIVIAGRSQQKCLAFKQQALEKYGKHIDYAVIDVIHSSLERLLKKISPDIVVNAAGPYQYQRGSGANYTVARACISASSHYIDLADDRVFVCNFSTELNREVKSKGLMLVTGASSVPGLSSAVIDEFLPQFSVLDSIHYGISPGNQTERGEATVVSILSYVGYPFQTLVDGLWQSVYGWQNAGRYDFGAPLGKRWMSNCDIPDLSLLPEYYPDLKTVRFQAGLELSPLHLGLWILSWLSRMGWIRRLVSYGKPLIKMSEWFMRWGSDQGGMFVELRGTGLNGKAKSIAWQLVAENGVGINVPTISAELLIQRISKADISVGAMPCVSLFSLDHFFEVAQRWGIYQRRKIL